MLSPLVAGFLSPCELELKDARDDGLWLVEQPLSYASVAVPGLYTVPVGFETDLASVPRLPFLFELCGMTSNEAAVLHDWLYATQPVTRVQADCLLREASKVTGVPCWRRWMMWAGVRIGGRLPWDKYKAQNIIKAQKLR